MVVIECHRWLLVFVLCLCLFSFVLSRLQFLCWDPAMRKAFALPAAEMPIHIAEYNSKFVILALDRFMKNASEYVRGVICDNHGAHLLLRRLWFGNATPEDKITLSSCNLSWLSRMTHQEYCLILFVCNDCNAIPGINSPPQQGSGVIRCSGDNCISAIPPINNFK